jgi:hypothetical protein
VEQDSDQSESWGVVRWACFVWCYHGKDFVFIQKQQGVDWIRVEIHIKVFSSQLRDILEERTIGEHELKGRICFNFFFLYTDKKPKTFYPFWTSFHVTIMRVWMVRLGLLYKNNFISHITAHRMPLVCCYFSAGLYKYAYPLSPYLYEEQMNIMEQLFHSVPQQQ